MGQQAYPPLAVAAVESFLASDDWRRHAIDRGWSISMVDPITLVVGLRAGNSELGLDAFTLRLACEECPHEPPDVRFVNPSTLEYDPATDAAHVPILVAPHCRTHLRYNYPSPYKYGPQLVCNSMTLGYYRSNHSPRPEQQWDPNRHSIGTSIQVVHSVLLSSHFRGRYG